MFGGNKRNATYLVLGLLVIVALVCQQHCDSLIITSVIAGNKKFKTVSFDSKFLKPLTFEKDLPSTEFRRHRTVRPPKFDIDVNIPIKLPLEDEYPKEEYRKPVENNFFFQTGEINEPNYEQGKKYPAADDQEYAASNGDQQQQGGQLASSASTLMRDGLKGLIPTLAKSIKFTPKIEIGSAGAQPSNARSDGPASMSQQFYPPQQMQFAQQQQQQQQQQHLQQLQQRQQQQQLMQQQPVGQAVDPMAPTASYPGPSYPEQPQYQSGGYEQQEFVPGGFINLQLSGPTGGPKATYEDYDKERWAQQLSQAQGAMPYPVLNYHQLQNYYGGLGTFTNGLAEHRYVEHSLLDKFKSGLNHVVGKIHLG